MIKDCAKQLEKVTAKVVRLHSELPTAVALGDDKKLMAIREEILKLTNQYLDLIVMQAANIQQLQGRKPMLEH